MAIPLGNENRVEFAKVAGVLGTNTSYHKLDTCPLLSLKVGQTYDLHHITVKHLTYITSQPDMYPTSHHMTLITLLSHLMISLCNIMSNSCFLISQHAFNNQYDYDCDKHRRVSWQSSVLGILIICKGQIFDMLTSVHAQHFSAAIEFLWMIAKVFTITRANRFVKLSETDIKKNSKTQKNFVSNSQMLFEKL
jgi:hypothetical protein